MLDLSVTDDAVERTRIAGGMEIINLKQTDSNPSWSNIYILTISLSMAQKTALSLLFHSI